MCVYTWLTWFDFNSLQPSYAYAENIVALLIDMGDKLLIKKDFGSAIDCYTFAVRMEPSSTLTHYKIATTLQVFLPIFQFLKLNL